MTKHNTKKASQKATALKKKATTPSFKDKKNFVPHGLEKEIKAGQSILSAKPLPDTQPALAPTPAQKPATLSTNDLREIANTVNPLAQLMRKNKYRAEKRATENKKSLRDVRLPLAGAVLEKKYKGREIAVKVLEIGFEYNGKYYKSLSAVACAITGQHISGYHFFGL